MALGFVDFTVGQQLTADLMDGLVRQTVMNFATTAARDAALTGVLANGMVAYAQDIKTYHLYDGTAWVILSEPPQSWNVASLTQGGSVACASSTGWYQRQRGIITVSMKVSISGTGSSGSVVIAPTPITLASNDFGPADAWWFDTSLPNHYVGTPRFLTTTTIDFVSNNGGSTSIWGTAPTSLQPGDTIRFGYVGRY